MLKLMYITNNPVVAEIAENAGVDRIFVDMEYMGKDERQKGLDSVKNHHTVDDCRNIRKVLKKADLMVRVNPLHSGSKEEIDNVIEAGADIVMLPYFKTASEVSDFVEYVDGRAVTLPLLETPQAVEKLHEILAIDGIDEMYIGLNDLSLGMKRKFVFEILADGTVDRIAEQINEKGIPFGFGGIAALGKGDVPADYIIPEHYRLHSSITILSRSFCRVDEFNPEKDKDRVENTFDNGVYDIRRLEERLDSWDSGMFEENRKYFKLLVDKVLEKK